jgi:hypothetical protein
VKLFFSCEQNINNRRLERRGALGILAFEGIGLRDNVEYPVQRVFVGFPSPSRQMHGKYPKLSLGSFLPKLY